MRLFGRNDTVLVAGLTIALFVIFSPVVSGLLEYARELDRDNGLQLMPALVILAAAFIFVQLWKRKEMRAEAVAGADAGVGEVKDFSCKGECAFRFDEVMESRTAGADKVCASFR